MDLITCLIERAFKITISASRPMLAVSAAPPMLVVPCGAAPLAPRPAAAAGEQVRAVVPQRGGERRADLGVAEDGAINRVFSVNLHDIDELGEGQEYQKFYSNELGGSLPSGDTELVVGVDLSRNDSFVMPVRQEVQIFEDDNLHRQKRAGWYGWAEQGFAVLDNRRVLLGSL